MLTGEQALPQPPEEAPSATLGPLEIRLLHRGAEMQLRAVGWFLQILGALAFTFPLSVYPTMSWPFMDWNYRILPALGLANIAIGIGLMKYWRWARWTASIMTGFTSAFFFVSLLGIPLMLFPTLAFFILLQPRVGFLFTAEYKEVLAQTRDPASQQQLIAMRKSLVPRFRKNSL